METTRLCIVRHGETDWNVDGRVQGHVDIPLNANGLAQAAAAARCLSGRSFAAVYSSDLGRARQTAGIVADAVGLEVQAATGLRERHYGIMQGLTAEESARQCPRAYALYRARDVDYDFETGESLTDFAARVVATFEALAAGHAGGSVLVVCHGGVLDICHRRATGRDLGAVRDFSIPNAALNWLEVGPGGWRLLAWADRRHLDRTLEESVE